MRAGILALAVVSVSVIAVGAGGCLPSGGDERAATRPALKEREAGAATKPIDPEVAKAVVEQYMAEMQGSKRGTEVPRVMDPPPPPPTPPAGISEAPKMEAVKPGPATVPSVVEFGPNKVSGGAGGKGPELGMTATMPGGRAGVASSSSSVIVIGPAARPPETAPAGDGGPVANPGGGTTAPAGAGETGVTGEVEAAVKGRMAKDPRDVSAALDGQLLAYLKGQSVPNAMALTGLPAEDREIVSAVVDGLVNFRSAVQADPNAMYTSKVRPFAETGDRLNKRADLSVPVVQFCTDIKGFGVYEPAPAALSARGETRTLLYYEVSNFSSRFTDARTWETRLSQQLSLYDASGRLVWQDPPRVLTDVCRNMRRDFFVRAALRIPFEPAGKYKLKVTVTDLNVGRLSEGELGLESK